MCKFNVYNLLDEKNDAPKFENTEVSKKDRKRIGKEKSALPL